MNRIDLIRSLNPHSGCEVGTRDGEFAAELLTIPSITSLTIIDAWQEFTEGPYLLDPANCSQAAQDCRERNVRLRFERDSRVEVIKALSPNVAEQFPDKSMDFVFIDGAHDYESVLNDLHAWSRVTDNLLCHDYVDSQESRKMGFGVVKAVEDFMEVRGWKLEAGTFKEAWPTVLLVQP
jgi:hypothetical protein